MVFCRKVLLSEVTLELRTTPFNRAYHLRRVSGCDKDGAELTSAGLPKRADT